MSADFFLRDNVLTVTQRWTLLVGLFLVGALIGWGIASLVPAPVRAETDLLVYFNADGPFEVPDDYKHWQMSQLDGFLFSETVLSPTLDALRDTSTWADADLADVERTLSVEWRNAGIWQMIAIGQDADALTDLLKTWKSVGLAAYAETLVHAQTAHQLDQRLQAIATEQVMRQTALEIETNASTRKTIEDELAALTMLYDEVYPQWVQANRDAKDLSVYLHIEAKNDIVRVQVERNVAAFALVGALIGLFGGLAFTLAQNTRKSTG